MMAITSYEKLEELGRVRLSRSFFMRDFLHSEIAAWHGFKNVPDHPDEAIALGRMLCEQLLEPLQETFGRIHVRSGYRSPEVNRVGNENKLNCASNEANYAHHIWDYPDSQGKRGATACIVIPWLVDHIEKGGSWTDMAWWIHDHLPYSTLNFFPKLAAFNINWHEAPIRRIDSYASPKGCLTRPGMANHAGSHADQYGGFPQLRKTSGEVAGARRESKMVVASPRGTSAFTATSTGVSAATKTPPPLTPVHRPEPGPAPKPFRVSGPQGLPRLYTLRKALPSSHRQAAASTIGRSIRKACGARSIATRVLMRPSTVKMVRLVSSLARSVSTTERMATRSTFWCGKAALRVATSSRQTRAAQTGFVLRAHRWQTCSASRCASRPVNVSSSSISPSSAAPRWAAQLP